MPEVGPESTVITGDEVEWKVTRFRGDTRRRTENAVDGSTSSLVRRRGIVAMAVEYTF